MMNVTTVRFHMGNEKDIAVGHNRRNPDIVKYEKHIDPNGKYLIWRDGDIQGVYEEIFGDAIKEYNAAQTRKDRLIDGVHGYIENVRNDTRGRKNKKTQRKGKSAAYEVVVGVGSVKTPYDPETGLLMRDDDGEYLTPYKVDEAICEEVLERYFKEWDVRNPQLRLYGAYYHADEQGVPHLHLDFVPWADGYKRGLSKQSAMDRALEQQGCKSEGMSKNSYVVWATREREYLEELIAEYGYDVLHPDAGKHKESLTWQAYAAQQDALKSADAQRIEVAKMTEASEQLQESIDEKTEELEQLTGDIDTITAMKTTIMPDGRSLWDHKMAEYRREQEEGKDASEGSKKAHKPRVGIEAINRGLEEEKADKERLRRVRERVLENKGKHKVPSKFEDITMESELRDILSGKRGLEAMKE